jgi:hypothetical protein
MRRRRSSGAALDNGEAKRASLRAGLLILGSVIEKSGNISRGNVIRMRSKNNEATI